MDPQRFDAITRALAAGVSRRWFVRAITGLGTGVLFRGLSARRSAEASGMTDSSTRPHLPDHDPPPDDPPPGRPCRRHEDCDPGPESPCQEGVCLLDEGVCADFVHDFLCVDETICCKNAGRVECHCGDECGVHCTEHERCAKSLINRWFCRCEAGYVRCNGTCVEGTCCTDDQCSLPNTVCVGSTCICAEGFTDCNGACIDPQTDETHCGACGQPCAPDRTCCAGACVDSAPLSPPFSGYTPNDEPDLKNPERGMYFGKVPGDGDFHTIVAKWLWLAPWCKAELIWDGQDSLSTSQVLSDYAKELNDARRAGYKVLFRPRYDKDEDGNPPSDCTFEEGGTVNVYHADSKGRQLRHISAVAKMLGEYKDVIAYIQAGYLGKWGEWNLEGGISRVPLLTNATNPSDITTYDRSHIIDHILSEYAAAGITQDVELRTPVFAREVVKRYEVQNKPPPNIGLHNDCFMSSMQSNEVPIRGSDSGTYSDFAEGDPPISLSPLNFGNTIAARAWAVDWTKDSSFGGETCPRDRDPEDDFSDENERWRVCDNMIGTNSEPESLNMSYLNGDFVGDKCRPSGKPGGQCLAGDVIVPGAVTTWTSGGCYDEIRHRLGYRFHVTSVEYTSPVAAGQSFQVRVQVANTGWARLQKPRQAMIVLRSGSMSYPYGIPEEMGGAVANWVPDQTTLLSVTACPPPPGTYSVRLWIPDPDVVDPNAPQQIPYAVKLATKRDGDTVFDPATGENDLGVEIEVQ